MTHISGFGQTGPLAGQAGFGSVGEAMGGIRHTNGSPDRPPSRAGISTGQHMASVLGVLGPVTPQPAARGRRIGPASTGATTKDIAATPATPTAIIQSSGRGW